MAFETEPTFKRFTVGVGIVRVTASEEVVAQSSCQFAAFGAGTKFGGALERAEPLVADRPLQPLNNEIALVARGKCSFEAKMRAAAAAGASGVLLANTDDEAFVAALDPPEARPDDWTPMPAIPLAVVGKSAASRLTSAYDEAAAAGVDVSVSVTMLSADDSLDDALRLPLFPVAQTLLPGQVLRMRVSKGERLALQTRFQLALNGEMPDGSPLPDDLGAATVAVVYVGDASRNVLASVGTLAHVDLETLRAKGGTHVTLLGVAPCNMRCLVRESTPKTFGQALVEPFDAGDWTFTADDGRAVTRAEVAAELRAAIRRVGTAAQQFRPARYTAGGSAAELAQMWENLPTDDLSLLTFKACALLGLGAKREASALQCRLPERVRVLQRLLRDLEIRYAAMQEGGTDEFSQQPLGFSPQSFVAAGVARVAPSLVIVEPEGGSGDERAAGFVVLADGLLVTNRHVANSTAGARVIFDDGSVERAVAVGESRDYDIAFLRVRRRGLAAATLGDSDRTRLGDWCVALGHPAELENLVTLGIASAIQTPVPTCPGISPHAMLDRAATFILTDALYNKGISGGPLLNAAGEVVGMNTFLRDDLNGLGGAIAANRIREAALELLDVEI